MPLDAFQSIAPGVPSLEDYQALLASPAFRTMERFSDAFVERHREAMKDYSRRWVRDPLHQWSRQWEYPFVMDALTRAFAASPPDRREGWRVLDAGSGVTFLPFWIADQLAGSTVTCCDQDASLAGIFERIASRDRVAVRFDAGGLQRLGYPDASFDALYCISVLEHTRDYPAILEEFARVLRPAAPLVLTFDVSLDGRSDVHPEAAERLMAEIHRRFVPSPPLAGATLAGMLAQPARLTTDEARRMNPSWLPWRLSWQGALLDLVRARIPEAPFYSCTVFGGVWHRRAAGGPRDERAV